MESSNSKSNSNALRRKVEDPAHACRANPNRARPWNTSICEASRARKGLADLVTSEISIPNQLFLARRTASAKAVRLCKRGRRFFRLKSDAILPLKKTTARAPLVTSFGGMWVRVTRHSPRRGCRRKALRTHFPLPHQGGTKRVATRARPRPEARQLSSSGFSLVFHTRVIHR